MIFEVFMHFHMRKFNEHLAIYMQPEILIEGSG